MTPSGLDGTAQEYLTSQRDGDRDRDGCINCTFSPVAQREAERERHEHDGTGDMKSTVGTCEVESDVIAVRIRAKQRGISALAARGTERKLGRGGTGNGGE